MFTGLVESVGKLVGRSGEHIRVRPARRFESPQFGESVAVNGCCLTLERDFPDGTLEFFTLAETLDRTNLGRLPIGSPVNLERAMLAGGRFGGHIVSGHIDGTGTIRDVRRDGNAVWYTIQAPEPILQLIVEKGSIAIDGISLTVARVDHVSFSVSIIPHTLQETALAFKRAGDIVNLENDCIGKYVAKLIGAEEEDKAGKGMTREFLQRYGF